MHGCKYQDYHTNTTTLKNEKTKHSHAYTLDMRFDSVISVEQSKIPKH